MRERVPRFSARMPDDLEEQLSSEEIDTLVEYLLSVDGGKGK